MSLTFEGETLTIGGRELTGTVLVDARVTDGSFDHAFGTERVLDLDFIPWGFVPDLGDLKLNDKLVEGAVQDWIDSHEHQIMRVYDRKVKASREE